MNRKNLNELPIEPVEKKMDVIMFKYWLQGFFEIADAKVITKKQIDIIKHHIELTNNAVMDGFVMWLSGVLTKRSHIDVNLTKIIQQNLNAQFDKIEMPKNKGVFDMIAEMQEQNKRYGLKDAVSPKIIC